MMEVGEPDKDETETIKIEENVDQAEKVLTKTQMKKLMRKEKRKQNWELKRKAKKEEQKAKKKLRKENGEKTGPSRKQIARSYVLMKNSTCKLKVVVDCSFDDYMSEKDIKYLVKQIMFSYSANRRSKSPLQFYCCGVNNKTKARLDSLEDSKYWDVYFHSESFESMFDKSSIVYLSSESPNILETLDEDKVYIIGGLVDHNHSKGLCHDLAEKRGLSHAQLPISKYINMKTRKVLSITHVFEILLHYKDTKDWKGAFDKVLPQRKFVAKKKKSRRKEELLKKAKISNSQSETNTGDNANSKSNSMDNDNSEIITEDNEMRETIAKVNDNSETITEECVMGKNNSEDYEKNEAISQDNDNSESVT